MSFRKLNSIEEMKARNRAALERMEQSILAGKRAMSELTATSRSPDGGVTAEIGSDNRVKKIEISKDAYESYDADTLAHAVIAVVRNGRRDLKRQRSQAFDNNFNSHR